VRLGQTAHGAPNDGGLFPPKIQAITALVVANEVGRSASATSHRWRRPETAAARDMALTRKLRQGFGLDSRARSDAGKKGRFVAGGVGPANRSSRFSGAMLFGAIFR
jgi:hypothetical protein